MNKATDYKAVWLRAVENAYVVFSGYRRPSILDSSPVKNASNILTDLTSAPLRNLSAIKLSEFVVASLYTIGTTLDYKHFLPRMLELMAGNDIEMSIYPDLIARKLNYAHFKDWPEEEVDAIQVLFRASFKSPDNSNIQNLLAGNIEVGNELEPLLNEVSAFYGANAARNIAELVVEVATKIDEPSWLGLSLSEPHKEVLSSWFRSKGVFNALYRGINLVLDEDAWEIETALSLLG